MMSTTRLYEGMNQGDCDSFFQLFLKHETVLARYFRWKHPGLAGHTLDLLSEAMVKGVKKVADGPRSETRRIEKGKFAAYMKVVIDNVVYDLYRVAMKRMVSFERPDDNGHRIDLEDTARKQPEKQVEYAEELERVRAALHAMKPTDREILVLWTLDVDYESIADAMGISRGAVCCRKCRALDRIRTAVGRNSDAD